MLGIGEESGWNGGVTLAELFTFLRKATLYREWAIGKKFFFIWKSRTISITPVQPSCQPQQLKINWIHCY